MTDFHFQLDHEYWTKRSKLHDDFLLIFMNACDSVTSLRSMALVEDIYHFIMAWVWEVCKAGDKSEYVIISGK